MEQKIVMLCLAVGLARLIGWTNIPAATNDYRRPDDDPQLLGLTT
ncbi:hypothetical protein [Nonomuraea turkmeniaca]|nr:hypothetical protein [Nonomuraea turkmeniaca]